MTESQRLYHHGILGQKWGVRRGPPYPIEDKVLSRGTRLRSVSSLSKTEKYKNRGRWMYTYNPQDRWDSQVYRGPFSYYLRWYKGSKHVYEHEYEVVGDLKMPTSKERIDEFINVYRQNKMLSKKELSYLRDTFVENGFGDEKIRSRLKSLDFDNLKTKRDWETAYLAFNIAMEDSRQFNITRKYAEAMSKKYDAMVDDNNQGIYNRVHDPVIIFRTSEALKSVGKRKISDKEIRNGYSLVQTELEKYGEKVKL